MNVSELIAKLSELDPSMRVVVNGYESGFDILNEIRIITVLPWQPTAGGVFGAGNKTEREEWNGELKLTETGEQVVCLPRTSN
jgi:hypothetical protein